MTWFFFLSGAALRASMLIALAGFVAYLCRRQSAAVRHLIWSAAILATLASPVVAYLMPVWSSSTPSPAILQMGARASTEVVQLLPSMVVNAGVSAARRMGTSEVLLSVWIAGVGAGLGALLLGMLRLTWNKWHAEVLLDSNWIRLSSELSLQFGLSRPVRLMLQRSGCMPVTWGLLRPYVLLPEEAATWTPERCRIVLAHELAHIHRHDWSVQMLAEFGRALYWFNPFVWIACNRLRQESEHACDDAVLNSGIDAPDYAEHLLDLARNLKSSERPWSVALAMARRSHLERRFLAMLNPTVNRRSVNKSIVFLTAAAALVLLIPLGALQAPAQSLAGKFFGTVYDPSGATVPNATVIAINPQARTRDMTTSNAAGVFEFSALPAATYSLEVLKPGFAKYTAPVTLEPNQGLHQKIILDLGTVQEQVQVTAYGTGKVQAAAPGMLRVGGNVQATKLVNKVQPIYPTTAKAAGIQGAVMLEAVISKEGNLLSLRVMNSQIDPDLAKAAVEAVSQWKYQPTLLNGEPVEILTRVDVNFTLLP